MGVGVHAAASAVAVGDCRRHCALHVTGSLVKDKFSSKEMLQQKGTVKTKEFNIILTPMTHCFWLVGGMQYALISDNCFLQSEKKLRKYGKQSRTVTI